MTKINITRERKYKGDRPHIRAKVLEEILGGASYVQACGFAGASSDALDAARDRDPEFDAQINEAVATRGELSVLRRHTLDDAGKEAVVELMREKHVTMTAAAEAVGTSSSTMAAERRRDPDFAAAVKAAQWHLDDCMENALFASGMKGHVKAQEVWLYNRRPDRWVPQRILERRIIEETATNAAIAAMMPEQVVDEMTAEEKLAAVEKLAKKWAERVPEDAPILRLVVNG